MILIIKTPKKSPGRFVRIYPLGGLGLIITHNNIKTTLRYIITIFTLICITEIMRDAIFFCLLQSAYSQLSTYGGKFIKLIRMHWLKKIFITVSISAKYSTLEQTYVIYYFIFFTYRRRLSCPSIYLFLHFFYFFLLHVLYVFFWRENTYLVQVLERTEVGLAPDLDSEGPDQEEEWNQWSFF